MIKTFKCTDINFPHMVVSNGIGICTKDEHKKNIDILPILTLNDNISEETKKVYEYINNYKNMKLNAEQIKKIRNYINSNKMSEFYSKIKSDDELKYYYEPIRKMNKKITDIPYTNISLLKYYNEISKNDINKMMSFFI